MSREEYRISNRDFYDRNWPPGRFDEFRYLLLKPTGELPDWAAAGHPRTHDTIPFLSREARDSFTARRVATECEPEERPSE
jgi:hypothetical protein